MPDSNSIHKTGLPSVCIYAWKVLLKRGAEPTALRLRNHHLPTQATTPPSFNYFLSLVLALRSSLFALRSSLSSKASQSHFLSITLRFIHSSETRLIYLYCFSDLLDRVFLALFSSLHKSDIFEDADIVSGVLEVKKTHQGSFVAAKNETFARAAFHIMHLGEVVLCSVSSICCY